MYWKIITTKTPLISALNVTAYIHQNSTQEGVCTLYKHNYHNSAIQLWACLLIFSVIQWSLFVVKLGKIWVLEWHNCQNGTFDWYMAFGPYSIQLTQTNKWLWKDIYRPTLKFVFYETKLQTKQSFKVFFFFKSYCRSYYQYKDNITKVKAKCIHKPNCLSLNHFCRKQN